jgi:hypothetical protein
MKFGVPPSPTEFRNQSVMPRILNPELNYFFDSRSPNLKCQISNDNRLRNLESLIFLKDRFVLVSLRRPGLKQ